MEVINILHLKSSAGTGGAETMLCYWPKFLNKSIFKQFFIFGEDGPLVQKLARLGGKVLVINGLNSFYGIFRLLKLFKFIVQNRIDVIHAHGARINFYGSIVALLTNTPIISTEHNIDIWRGKNNAYKFIDKFASKVNIIRVGVSDAVCSMLHETGLPLSRISCIENGIDTENYLNKYDDLIKKKEFGLEPDYLIIGTVGRLVEQKGHKYLIEAFALLLDKLPKATLVVVGDGPLRNELLQFVEKLGISDKIVFTGNRDDVPELISIMDIFVLPSITEGLPLALLESMASQKPAVASTVSGIPSVIEDGVDGYLVPPCNPLLLFEKLQYLCNHPENRSKVSKAARDKIISKYNAKTMILKYELLYKTLLENKQNDK